MKPEQYRTKDLGEAAALLVKEASLTDIERIGNVCWFIFENGKSCKDIATQFHFGTVIVDARAYYEAVKRLKSRIFNL